MNLEAQSHLGLLQPKGFPGLPDNWTSDWETFPSADGQLQLFGAMYHAKEWKGERTLVVFHGLNEHGGRYLHFPHYLKGTVDSIYCMDHRGHGRSEGLRGYVERFSQLSDDVSMTIRRVEESMRRRFGRSEVHAFGHSFGGLVLLRALFGHQDLPIYSSTVSAPLLGLQVRVPLAKRAAAHALSKLWGSLHMTTEVHPDDISHDREVVAAYQADRLVHKKATPRLYTELVTAMADTVSRHEGFNYPLLAQVPLQDKIVDSEITLGFFKHLKQRDKLLKTYPTFFHESFNEIGKEEAFKDLETWIKQHSKN